MSFGTVINCMDGRTQLPALQYLKRHLEVDYVDSVTEPGPVRILAEEPESAQTHSILNRVRTSTDKHGSRCVAIVAHYDCAGNPAPKDAQLNQLDLAVRFIAAQCPGIRILGLWIDETWAVTQISAAQD
jgi:hypothetical protein